MTPERQEWWDSLPGYEKQARNAIKESKRKIKWAKEELPHAFGHYGEAIKDGLRRNKFLIKALRKQIAMRPVIKKEFKMFRYCPTCDCILNVSRTSPNCDRCGQKLRWEE